jgi:hypothetical protein
LQRGEGTEEEIGELMACIDRLEYLDLSESEILLLFDIRRKITKRLPMKAAS